MFTALRHTLRSLARQPFFSLTTVAILALGIGACTIVFSILHAVLLRPLPYPEPERLVRVWSQLPSQGNQLAEVSLLRFRQLQSLEDSPFASLAASARVSYAATGRGEPEQLAATKVSGPFFETLGIAPELGRLFLAAEDKPGAAPVVLLSHAYWQRAFNGARDVAGRTLTLDGQPHTIVGVLPPRLAFPFDQAAVWTPRAFETTELGQEQIDHGASYLALIARLRPGVTPEQLQSRLDVTNRGYVATHAGFIDVNWSLTARALTEEVVGGHRRILWQLLAAVGFVLLIACANVANLFLTRAVARQREAAVRIALGGSRARILREYLGEGLLLAGAGAGAGTLLAVWGVPLIVAFAGGQIPRAAEIGVHGPVLAFAAILALGCGAVLGLVPLVQISRVDCQQALRDGGHGTTGSGRSWLRPALITGEVALALLLLAGAGLLLTSFSRVQRVPVGFNPSGLHVASLSLPTARYSEAQVVTFVDRMHERLRGTPGITRASAGFGVPFTGEQFLYTYTRPEQPGERLIARYSIATPGYLPTLGAALVAGRDFNDGDRTSRQRVVVINETMARRLFADGQAVGRTFHRLFDQTDWLVVGVVRDIRTTDLVNPPAAETYFPFDLNAYYVVSFLLRDSAGGALAASAFRTALKDIDPQVPVVRSQPVAALMQDSLADRRLVVWLLTGFAAAALVLAAAGIASVVAYHVAQRTPEIGVRLALGATTTRIVREILARGMRPVALGLLLGLAATAALTGLLGSQLFQTEPLDPLVLSGTVLLLASAAILACWLPARRASRIDPLVALRSE